MTRYRVRGNCETYMEIVGEHGEGFEVEITRYLHDLPESRRETMSRELFEICMKTDYLIPVGEADAIPA